MIQRLIFIGSVLAALSACNLPPSQIPGNGAEAPAVVQGMSESEIQALIQSYKDFPALNTDLKRSDTHQGMMVRTHLDPTAMQAYQNKAFPYANGAEVVKEGHMGADGPVSALFIMKKIEGYDPENGDWFYAMANGDGMVGEQGRMQMCISCHGAARDKDFIYGFE